MPRGKADEVDGRRGSVRRDMFRSLHIGLELSSPSFGSARVCGICENENVRGGGVEQPYWLTDPGLRLGGL